MIICATFSVCLGSTHAQVHEYSQRRTNKISEAVQSSIEKIVRETQAEQQHLLDDAHQQSMAIEHGYSDKLML
jgi:gas vesicle protein